MPNRIKIKNQIVDFDAVQYALFTPATDSAEATVRLCIGGQPLEITEDAERIWKLIEASDIDAPMADGLAPIVALTPTAK